MRNAKCRIPVKPGCTNANIIGSFNLAQPSSLLAQLSSALARSPDFADAGGIRADGAATVKIPDLTESVAAETTELSAGDVVGKYGQHRTSTTT